MKLACEITKLDQGVVGIDYWSWNAFQVREGVGIHSWELKPVLSCDMAKDVADDVSSMSESLGKIRWRFSL